MGELIRILVVDDHPVVRQGLRAILQTQPDMVVVAEATTGEEAVAAFGQHWPDVTLMDLRLPGMGGAEAVRAVRRNSAEARIIVLTTYDGDEDIYRALEAGARAYLVKNSVPQELLETVRAVCAGERRVPPAVATRLVERLGWPDLTPRERQVLQLVAQGMRNKEVANALSITEDAVKWHMKAVLGKLQAKDRTQAVTIALRRGMISL